LIHHLILKQLYLNFLLILRLDLKDSQREYVPAEVIETTPLLYETPLFAVEERVVPSIVLDASFKTRV